MQQLRKKIIENDAFGQLPAYLQNQLERAAAVIDLYHTYIEIKGEPERFREEMKQLTYYPIMI